MYCGYVTTLKNVRPHPNADRMKLADCFGNTVCVGLDAAEGEIGIYFPSDGQLSMEFAKENNLLRLYDENGHSIPGGGYLEPDKRNIKAISLRGVKSDGLFCSLSCVAYTGVNLDTLNVGDTITVVNGHDICQKYIPRGKRDSDNHGPANRTRKKKAPLAPLFAEHADTEQLAYNLAAFKPGDEIEITLKMHGTSQRTGYLPVLKGYKRSLLDKILQRPGVPVYDWDYVTGTRRTVLDSFEGGFYGSNEFREDYHTLFKNKLWKGETVYYEVVGYTHTDADNRVINGHEITIVGVERDKKGNEVFVCNDTDDFKDASVRYDVKYLLPKIHHAGSPVAALKDDPQLVSSWFDSLTEYKNSQLVAQSNFCPNFSLETTSLKSFLIFLISNSGLEL